MDSGIINNTILKNCAQEDLVSTTLWPMREANLQEGTSGVMNWYRMKVERIMKEKRLAKHRQEKQGSDKY